MKNEHDLGVDEQAGRVIDLLLKVPPEQRMRRLAEIFDANRAHAGGTLTNFTDLMTRLKHHPNWPICYDFGEDEQAERIASLLRETKDPTERERRCRALFEANPERLGTDYAAFQARLARCPKGPRKDTAPARPQIEQMAEKLTPRGRRAVRQAGFQSIEEFAERCGAKDLRKLGNCGERTIREIRTVLAAYGFSLKD